MKLRYFDTKILMFAVNANNNKQLGFEIQQIRGFLASTYCRLNIAK